MAGLVGFLAVEKQVEKVRVVGRLNNDAFVSKLPVEPRFDPRSYIDANEVID